MVRLCDTCIEVLKLAVTRARQYTSLVLVHWTGLVALRVLELQKVMSSNCGMGFSKLLETSGKTFSCI